MSRGLNDLNLFWVYHFGNFMNKKTENEGIFHFLPRMPETLATPLLIRLICEFPEDRFVFVSTHLIKRVKTTLI